MENMNFKEEKVHNRIKEKDKQAKPKFSEQEKAPRSNLISQNKPQARAYSGSKA